MHVSAVFKGRVGAVGQASSAISLEAKAARVAGSISLAEGSRSHGTLPPPLRGRPWHSWFGGPMIRLPQALHIMRHLWPSVPLYNSARLYQALKPVLRAEGSRIEGLMVGPTARAVAD